MPNRLPSLTALRTFEAAARHKSFSKAGEELAVTPAAVGFQIKQLEEELGALLFVRKHRAVELTPMGEAFAHNLAPAFETIAIAWQDVEKRESAAALRVTAPENAVLDWLMPATTSAKSARPGPLISWDASREIRDFASGAWDVALRVVPEPDERFFCEPVMRHWFTPVMRPDVAHHVHSAEDILRHDLVNTEYEKVDGWPAFLKVMELPPDPVFAMTCPGTRIAVELAVTTNVVALGGYFVADKYLRAGDLMSPIPVALMPAFRMWLMCTRGRENSDEIMWLRETLHASADTMLETTKGFSFYEMDGSPVATMI